MIKAKILLNDETGIAILYKGIITNTVNIFDHLMKSDWRQEEIKMMGKTYMAKRQLCTYGDDGVTYSFGGKTEGCVPWETNPGIVDLRYQIESITKTKFNYVVTNLYLDNNAKIGYHSDKEKDLVPGAKIVSANLGSTREFRIQPITKKFTIIGRKRPNLIKIDLEDGDLLIMGGNLQSFWKHAVLESKIPCGPRINSTFRVMK